MKTILEYLVNNHIKTNNIEYLDGYYKFAGLYNYVGFKAEGDDWVKINVEINNKVKLNLFYTQNSSYVYYVNPQKPKKWGAFRSVGKQRKEIIDAICEKPEDFYKIVNRNNDNLSIISEFEDVRQNLI